MYLYRTLLNSLSSFSSMSLNISICCIIWCICTTIGIRVLSSFELISMLRGYGITQSSTFEIILELMIVKIYSS